MQAPRETVEPFPGPRAERSVAGLLSDLARQANMLLRQEIALAKAEVLGTIGQIGTGAGLLVVGLLVGFAGFLFLLVAAMMGLSRVVDLWLAALIVGGVVIAVGVALVWIGRARFQAERLSPQRTIRSLRDDAAWARELIR